MEQVGAGSPWCIVLEGARPAGISEPGWNMALDALNLESVVMNGSIPRMRLYQWAGPAITLGRFQDLDRSINKEVCREMSIPIARRPTGGRGILHGSDLTISVAISLEALNLDVSASITDIYGSISATLVAAFASVGLDADRGCCVSNDRGHSADCMATVSRADIVAASSGAKLLGAALLRKSNSMLLQCTISANNNYTYCQELQSAVFLGAAPVALPPPAVPLLELRAAVINEMRSRLCASPDAYELSQLDVQKVIERSVECQIAI
jgi:lipoate-protein ligase A